MRSTIWQWSASRTGQSTANPASSRAECASASPSRESTIPRPRTRDELVEHPNYYAIRNHLVHFLASRSADMAGKPGEATPPIETVHIDRTAPAAVSGVSDSAAEAPLRAVND